MRIWLYITGTRYSVAEAAAVEKMLTSTEAPLGNVIAGHLNYCFVFPDIEGRRPDGSCLCNVGGTWATSQAELNDLDARNQWLRRLTVEELKTPGVAVTIVPTAC